MRPISLGTVFAGALIVLVSYILAPGPSEPQMTLGEGMRAAAHTNNDAPVSTASARASVSVQVGVPDTVKADTATGSDYAAVVTGDSGPTGETAPDFGPPIDSSDSDLVGPTGKFHREIGESDGQASRPAREPGASAESVISGALMNAGLDTEGPTTRSVGEIIPPLSDIDSRGTEPTEADKGY
jgi:hypothetical protein